MSVFLADDHPVFIAGIGRIIAGTPGVEVIGTAANGRDALGRILELSPDVAVVDISMPEISGLQLLSALREIGSATRVIILTGTESRDTLATALNEGASGYLLKTIDWDDLVDAIRKVARGDKIFPRDVTDLAAIQGPTPKLTPREHEVLNCLAKDLTATQIAHALNIGTSTVNFHTQRIYKKLGVGSRAAAVREAMRRGMIR